MDGPTTATHGQNFVSSNPQSLYPSLSPTATATDHSATNATPRGQVNAWGWPSKFNHLSQVSASGPSHSFSPPAAVTHPPSMAADASMYNPQTQLSHQHPAHPQLQQQQPQQLQHQRQQQHLQHLQQQPPNQQGLSQSDATIYPPQPYGNPAVISASNNDTSPNSAGKARTPNSSAINMSKKRNSSKSPDLDSKRVRLPDDANESQPDSNLASADARIWGEEATKLDVYVWDYLSRRGFKAAAKALMNEACMAEPPEVPLKTPQGLLFEYWAIFWDVFAARSGRGGAEAAAYFEYQESRNAQRLIDANRKAEMLESQFQPPDNSGRFPSLIMPGHSNDPNVSGSGAMNGRLGAGPAVWNPAALPQAQQQQLLITAAQRQNIPLHEIKNLSPASRMALINSMNPNNPINAQAMRPGMNGQQMEQQLQARLQQQQALHRMMQQQRQTSAPHSMAMPMPGTPSQVQMAGHMQSRPPMAPQSMPGTIGSPAPPTPGGVPDGRRSAGPGQSLGSDPNRPEHLQNMPPGAQQPGMPPGGGPSGPPPPPQQHPQLNPQQQQMVMSQFQNVQAVMREEWMKAQNAPNQTTAADFYANVQAYQAKAQGLQNLLRAQSNYQGGPGSVNNGAPPDMPGGTPGPPMHPGAPGQPQVRPPNIMGPGSLPGSGGGSPVANMSNMTPQQRAAQIANAQAAAGKITPAMATHDPGLMASMMGPSNMPNGGGPRPPTPHQQNGPDQQLQQPGQGPPHQHSFVQPTPQGLGHGQMQQQAGPARPSSSQQDRSDDPNANHFTSAQITSSPANVQRPLMQRTASTQHNAGAGGMGPPGPTSISSPSPRIQAGNLQQSNSTQQSQDGSPAANVPNTPKMGSAEKGKKGNPRQRKNSKAATKTPTLTAASVPGSTASSSSATVASASNGGPAPSTPAATSAPTPVSTSAATPGRSDAPASSVPAQMTSQSQEAVMPPPPGLTLGTEANVSLNTTSATTEAQDSSHGSAPALGASGGSNDDYSVFGFGTSMNDLFDFDLSTDGGGGQNMAGESWENNYGNLFGGAGSGAQGDATSGGS